VRLPPSPEAGLGAERQTAVEPNLSVNRRACERKEQRNIVQRPDSAVVPVVVVVSKNEYKLMGLFVITSLTHFQRRKGRLPKHTCQKGTFHT
jgi:hypothetical protein